MAFISWSFHSMVLALWFILTVIHALPPPQPINCNQTGCDLSNSYGVWGDRKGCHADKILYPTTEEELRLAVADAAKNSFKVKTVSKFSHTIPKLACPTDQTSKSTIFVSTEKYNSVIEVDASTMTVTAESGVGLRTLIDAVEGAGVSLVPAPYWEGVSVGGVISTGGHGSSWWGKGGAVHDHVVGIRLVVPAKESEGFAKIVMLGPQDPSFNAAKLSLGLLGVISKVTFSLESGFKRSVTYNFTGDDDIEENFEDHAKTHEFADITWYPSQHTAVYRYDDRIPLDTQGDGVNDFLGFQANSILISKSTRATEKSFEKARNVNGKCTMASTFLGAKKLIANGLKSNPLLFTGYPVVGHQGKMQTSGSCLYSSPIRIDVACAWDPRFNGLFFYESTAMFTTQNFANFLHDVKELRDLNPNNLCGIDIYNGILIRFIKASKAYLGQSEDSVVVDFNYYRADDASTPRLNQDLWEEIEQMAFFKYGARPHWAKNRNLAFAGVEEKYPKFGKFIEVKNEYDPYSVFSSEWSDEIVFGKQGEKGDGCALEGLCICSEDRHCSPSKGYSCQYGFIYKEARVCRYSS